MATASTAGAWQGGGRPERPYPARAPRPVMSGERPTRSTRPARSGSPVPGRAGDRLRATEREYAADPRDRPREPRADRPTGRPAAARPAQPPARPRTATSAPGGSRLRGAVAVLAVFLVTLAGCAVDSFIGMGLGAITLMTLTATTAIATWLVRRRDLFTVVVAPPLVFVLVAVVNISLAPSASLNLATMATLLVRGFPTMAIATAAAIVVSLLRLVSRR